MRIPFVVCLVAACAAPQGQSSRATENRPTSQRAATSELGISETADRTPIERYACGDPVLADQVTSGGQRITTFVPCWKADEPTEPAPRRRFAEPAREGAEPVATAEAELVQCKGISERELVRTPFAAPGAVAQISPYGEGDRVRGVQLVLDPAPGLSAWTVERLIACHQARYESLGRPATYLPQDPTLIPGARITVTEQAGRVVVLVEAPDDVSAQAALARARSLAVERTAER